MCVVHTADADTRTDLSSLSLSGADDVSSHTSSCETPDPSLSTRTKPRAPAPPHPRPHSAAAHCCCKRGGGELG